MNEPNKDTQTSEKTVETPKERQIDPLQKLDAIVKNKVKRKYTRTGTIKGIPQTSPEAIKKIKLLAAKEHSYTEIASKTGVCRQTVSNIVNNPVVKEQIDDIKAVLATKFKQLANDSLDAIRPDEIINASLVSKATLAGIATDKYIALTDNNTDNTVDFNLLTGLKGQDIKDFINSGNTVKIGISIEPKENNSVTQTVKHVIDAKE